MGIFWDIHCAVFFGINATLFANGDLWDTRWLVSGGAWGMIVGHTVYYDRKCIL